MEQTTAISVRSRRPPRCSAGRLTEARTYSPPAAVHLLRVSRVAQAARCRALPTTPAGAASPANLCHTIYPSTWPCPSIAHRPSHRIVSRPALSHCQPRPQPTACPAASSRDAALPTMASMTTLFHVGPGPDEFVEFHESFGSKAFLQHVWDEQNAPLTHTGT